MPQNSANCRALPIPIPVMHEWEVAVINTHWWDIKCFNVKSPYTQKFEKPPDSFAESMKPKDKCKK